jgi:hypothetical protein
MKTTALMCSLLAMMAAACQPQVGVPDDEVVGTPAEEATGSAKDALCAYPTLSLREVDRGSSAISLGGLSDMSWGGLNVAQGAGERFVFTSDGPEGLDVVSTDPSVLRVTQQASCDGDVTGKAFSIEAIGAGRAEIVLLDGAEELAAVMVGVHDDAAFTRVGPVPHIAEGEVVDVTVALATPLGTPVYSTAAVELRAGDGHILIDEEGEALSTVEGTRALVYVQNPECVALFVKSAIVPDQPIEEEVPVGGLVD